MKRITFLLLSLVLCGCAARSYSAPSNMRVKAARNLSGDYDGPVVLSGKEDPGAFICDMVPDAETPIHMFGD